MTIMISLISIGKVTYRTQVSAAINTAIDLSRASHNDICITTDGAGIATAIYIARTLNDLAARHRTYLSGSFDG